MIPNGINALESLAKEKLQPHVYDYIMGGAGDEISLNHNLKSYDDICLLPRVLHGVSVCDTSISLIDLTLSMPVIIGPTAFHQLVHPQGEIATIEAAANVNISATISTMATVSLEQISENATCPLWFQLYLYKDRQVSAALIKRAEKAGFRAIMLTVDVPVMGRRYRDLKNNFALPSGLVAANFVDVSLQHINHNPHSTGLKSYTDELFDRCFTWKDLAWIRSITNLPIILKGIMRPDDAKLALEHGINALVVSNHGGRQLDTMPSAIDMLPEITKIIDKKIPVLIDGGISKGIDVFKALALGADAILVGRPVLWALAVDGVRGLTTFLERLKADLIETMIICGYKDISDIKKNGYKVLHRK